MERKEKIDIKEIIKLTQENIKTILVILSIFIMLGVVYTLAFVKPLYQTKAKVLINLSSTPIAELMPDDDTIKNTAKELKLDYSEVRRSIEVIYTKNAKTIEVFVNYKNALQSYNIANKYIELLGKKLKEYYEVSKYEVITKAEVAYKPSNIHPITDTLKFLVFGIVASCIYIISLKFKEGITNENEIEQIGVRALGRLKQNEQDKIDKITVNIELNNKNRNPKTILISNINNYENDSIVISKIAENYKNKKKKVLIINSRFTKKKEYAKQIETKTVQELGIKQENLADEEVLQIIEELKGKYDVILIDTDAITEEIAPIVWANIVEAVVLIVKYRKTEEKEIIEAKKTIENVSGKIIGAILEE